MAMLLTPRPRPTAAHRYLYAGANPITHSDPSGPLKCPRWRPETLRQALRLWRADPLAEFRGLPFAESARPRSPEEWLQVQLAAVENELAVGRHVELVGELQQLVAEFPLHERSTNC